MFAGRSKVWAWVIAALSVGVGGAAVAQNNADHADQRRVVGSTAELLRALKAARDGDTIALMPGSYADVNIGDLDFKTPVILTSQDQNHPAKIVGLKMNKINGMRFSYLELTSQGVADPYYAFRVGGCNDVSFDHLDVHGDPQKEPGLQAMGFYMKYDNNIAIEDSHFHDINAGIVAGVDEGVSFQRNLFERVSKGGIEMGGISSAIIADNVFTDFHVDQGVHPDAIQMFTAGTKEPSRDITITGNLFYRGKGHAVQGIFIGDEIGLPYQRLRIENNAIIGGTWHGIYVFNPADNLVMKNNIVASWPGLDLEGVGTAAAKLTPPKVLNFYSWILINRNTSQPVKITETGNRAQFYNGAPAFKGQPPGNQMLGRIDDEGRSLIREWAKRLGRAPPADL